MSKRELILQPYTNRDGDVINPGDPIFYLTCAAHNTQLHSGVYLGYYETKGWRGHVNKKVVVQGLKYSRAFTNDAHEEYDTKAESIAIPAPKYPNTRGLGYSSPEYKAAMDAYQAEYKEYQKLIEARREGYSVKKYYVGTKQQCLQRNEIYPYHYVGLRAEEALGGPRIVRSTR